MIASDAMDDADAEVALLREVLSTAAHELGGLASALGLRTDAIASVLEPRDAAAMRAIADEIRALGRQLRRLRGPSAARTRTEGSARKGAAGRGPLATSVLAPAGERALSEWISTVERFGRPALGRGVTLTTTAADGTIGDELAHSLGLAMLALFRAVRESRGERPVTVELRVKNGVQRRGHESVEVAIDVRWGGSGASPPLAEQPWYAYALRRTARSGLAWETTGDLEIRICGPADASTHQARDENSPSG